MKKKFLIFSILFFLAIALAISFAVSETGLFSLENFNSQKNSAKIKESGGEDLKDRSLKYMLIGKIKIESGNVTNFLEN